MVWNGMEIFATIIKITQGEPNQTKPKTYARINTFDFFVVVVFFAIVVVVIAAVVIDVVTVAVVVIADRRWLSLVSFSFH